GPGARHWRPGRGGKRWSARSASRAAWATFPDWRTGPHDVGGVTLVPEQLGRDVADVARQRVRASKLAARPLAGEPAGVVHAPLQRRGGEPRLEARTTSVTQPRALSCRTTSPASPPTGCPPRRSRCSPSPR